MYLLVAFQITMPFPLRQIAPESFLIAGRRNDPAMIYRRRFRRDMQGSDGIIRQIWNADVAAKNLKARSARSVSTR